MTVDFEPVSPPSNLHPTIYLVHLGRVESVKWEADAVYRAAKTAEWQKRARARGKSTIEVHGHYCQLASFNVEEL